MSNQEAYENLCEKAEKYDALTSEINTEIAKLKEKIAECEKDYERSYDSMAACLVGRKYAYKEVIEIMERWCK